MYMSFVIIIRTCLTQDIMLVILLHRMVKIWYPAQATNINVLEAGRSGAEIERGIQEGKVAEIHVATIS